NKECSSEEVEQVLNWFETEAGRSYLNEKVEEERMNIQEQNFPISSEIPSRQIFSRIQRDKQQPNRKQWLFLRVAAVLIIGVMLSIASFWIINDGFKFDAGTEYITYSTEQGQQKIITLTDGSTVRLNNNSKLTFPKTFSSPKRAVTLKGEAYFQIASNPNKPFVVNAGK